MVNITLLSSDTKTIYTSYVLRLDVPRKERIHIRIIEDEELLFFKKNLPMKSFTKSIMSLVISYNNEVRKKQHGN